MDFLIRGRDRILAAEDSLPWKLNRIENKEAQNLKKDNNVDLYDRILLSDLL